MAHRLATEYVKAHIALSKGELDQFIETCIQQYREVKLESQQDRTVIHFDDNGSEVTLTFVKEGDQFVCKDSYRIHNLGLANMMRKMMTTFKGDAVVNRIYSNFVMVYYYNHGSVVRIKEIKDEHERLVYEYKDHALQLQRLFDQNGAEQEIEAIQGRINQLLDERNSANQMKNRKRIDEQLAELSRKLFVLEA